MQRGRGVATRSRSEPLPHAPAARTSTGSFSLGSLRGATLQRMSAMSVAHGRPEAQGNLYKMCRLWRSSVAGRKFDPQEFGPKRGPSLGNWTMFDVARLRLWPQSRLGTSWHDPVNASVGPMANIEAGRMQDRPNPILERLVSGRDPADGTSGQPWATLRDDRSNRTPLKQPPDTHRHTCSLSPSFRRQGIQNWGPAETNGLGPPLRGGRPRFGPGWPVGPSIPRRTA